MHFLCFMYLAKLFEYYLIYSSLNPEKLGIIPITQVRKLRLGIFFCVCPSSHRWSMVEVGKR